MDVRKKFTLNMTTLVIIVIILGVLVFFSATRNPLSQPSSEDPTVNFDPESLFNTEETVQETSPMPTETPPSEEPTPQEDDVIATITFTDNQAPQKQLQAHTSSDSDEVSYTIRLHASWSERLHPAWYPQGAHLSPMVVWSHRLKNALFRENSIASDGMEIMAETGATKTLTSEIEDAIRTGSVFSYATGSVFNAPGENTTRVSTIKNVPYVTVVSMIAPSPDWFIAARNVQLYKNGRWLERVSIPAVLYDAGTDSGTEFTSPNDDTNPQQLITKIRNVPSIPIASFEFVKN